MPSKKRKKGDEGEEVAVSYLKDHKYKVLERNYSNKFGEIDVIAKRGKTIIFVEVKSQTTPIIDGLYPERNVTRSKQKKMIRAAKRYLIEKKYPEDTEWQADVIGIYLNEVTRMADLCHSKNCIFNI